MGKSLIEHSKIAYGTEGNATNEDIIAGSLQRIANATELMAKNYLQLESDLKWAKQSRDSWQAAHNRLEKKNAALKGVITKLKNKLNSDKNDKPSVATDDASSNTDH